MSEGLLVTGGLEVPHDALRRMAVVLDDTARDLLALAADRHRLLVDGDLLAGALVHPLGVARVEAALAAALDGPAGVVAAALRLEVRAGQLLLAEARYRAADALEAELVQLRRWLLGVTAPVLLPVATVVAVGWPTTVDEIVAAAGALESVPLPGLLGPLPPMVDAVVRFVDGGGLLLPRDLAETAGLLARLYDEPVPPGRAGSST